jgi:hypothetical protein
VGEFIDLREAYIEMDRLANIHGLTYGVRIARQHRAQVERSWESQKVRNPIDRVVIGE